jgi:hypothetical protein
LQVQRQLVEQAIEPLFKGKRLVALAHFQQAHGLAAQCRAVLLQAFKQALEEAARVGIAGSGPARGCASAEAAPRRTRWPASFAESRRRIDQQQRPPALQALAQAGAARGRPAAVAGRNARPAGPRPDSRIHAYGTDLSWPARSGWKTTAVWMFARLAVNAAHLKMMAQFSQKTTTKRNAGDGHHLD